MDICRLMRPFFVRSVTRRGSSPCRQDFTASRCVLLVPAQLLRQLPHHAFARCWLKICQQCGQPGIYFLQRIHDSPSTFLRLLRVSTPLQQLRSRLRCSPEYGPSAAGLRSGRKVPARKQNHLSGVFSELANSENGQYRTRWRTCASSPLPKKKWPG